MIGSKEQGFCREKSCLILICYNLSWASLVMDKEAATTIIEIRLKGPLACVGYHESKRGELAADLLSGVTVPGCVSKKA